MLVSTVLEQANYYDRRWQQEAYANGLQAARCAAVLSALHEIQLNEPRILDLGCGTGWLAAILSQFGPTTAIDLSALAVEVAAQKYPWVRFYNGDIFAWSRIEVFGFDVIVSQEVIEHVADQAGYLRIASGLLRDRGYLILTTPNAGTLRAMSNARSWSNQPIENVLTMRALRSMVSRYFEIIETTTIVPGFGDRGMYRLLNSKKWNDFLGVLKLRRAYRGLLLRAGLGLHTVIVARKRCQKHAV
jgi:2-polyprenyl-3-methyl-5-hydroxy-6-metoxy-1,4-benzoquinol methylase